jgi:hypothetical protein
MILLYLNIMLNLFKKPFLRGFLKRSSADAEHLHYYCDVVQDETTYLMGLFQNLSISEKTLQQDSLQINKPNGKVHTSARIFRYRDRDTRQIVYYIPSLELSSYGSTEKKAFEMLKSSLEDFFGFLIKLPQNKMEAELIKLGWKQEEYKDKEFSKAYIDSSGDLNDFNAVADQIETLTVEA